MTGAKRLLLLLPTLTLALTFLLLLLLLLFTLPLFYSYQRFASQKTRISSVKCQTTDSLTVR